MIFWGENLRRLYSNKGSNLNEKAPSQDRAFKSINISQTFHRCYALQGNVSTYLVLFFLQGSNKETQVKKPLTNLLFKFSQDCF
jgi:hypothetical protein